jgi:hypothetical protein
LNLTALLPCPSSTPATHNTKQAACIHTGTRLLTCAAAVQGREPWRVEREGTQRERGEERVTVLVSLNARGLT